MEVLFLIAITLPLVLLFILRNYYNGSKSNRRVPGPPGLPLIGNMHQFDNIKTHVYLHQLSKKYGSLMSLKLGSVPMLVISSASAAREVFKYHDLCFSNRPTSVGIDRLSYNDLGFVFAPYGDHWKSMRKLSAQHLFNSKRSQSFQLIRDEEIARMVKEIRDGAAADSNIVDLSKTFMDLTSSVIFRINFGKRYVEDKEDCAENENSTSKFHSLIRETQLNSVNFFFEDYFPLLGGLIDSLNGAWTRLEKNFSETDAFYQQLIDENIRASSVSSFEDCSSILDILLQMRKDSSDFTFDQIKAILMNNAIGVGGVMRDEEGRFVCAMCKQMEGLWQPREAEAISLREVLSWTKQYGVTRCIFETDSKLLADAYNRERGNSYFHSIVNDCVEISKHFQNVLVQFVHRSANEVAHLLARASHSESGLREWSTVAPDLIMDVMFADSI